MNQQATPPDARLLVDGLACRITDLNATCGKSLLRLPYVLRLLLENVLRHAPFDQHQAVAEPFLAWLETGHSETEIAFRPGRLLMHDTTSTPALVDIAAMRNALEEAGVDPSVLNPVVPVDVSVDHSLAVEVFGQVDAPSLNMRHEMRRNAERYRFLRWASVALRDVRIHPPGTGIMHTINLEQLASVVTTEERDGERWVVPDTLIGTDSHTPMVNGIGVLGWGVGGLEAQTVMFGMPTMLRIPDVVGVRLTGELRGGALGTDLALTVTQRLRAAELSGEFVEFFGPGVSTLTAGERAVVANMAPEYGATTGFFAIDPATLAYLRDTGRSTQQVERVETYARRASLWFDPQGEPRFTRVVEIALDGIGQHIAGPRRPQDLLSIAGTKIALEAIDAPREGIGPLPRHAIAIAAITSCTNTSDPRLLIAAGLLARKARMLGLKVPAWVKTSLAPGSPSAATYLARAGLLPDLDALGFGIVGYGCTSCIGNSGPLTPPILEALAAGHVHPVAVLSGNRNFPGRVHPDLDLGFIMSPPLVIAFALAGDAGRNLSVEPVQIAPDGRAVHLHDLLPTREEIATLTAQSTDPSDCLRDFVQASRNPQWQALKAAASPLYPWNPESTTLRRPPFAALSEGSLLGRYAAHALLVLGDDVTTDHISPASAIPQDSLAADHLVAHGESRADLNVFASRRGNWEVMVRGAFQSNTLVNLLQPGLPPAHTVHAPSGEVQPIWEVAQRYRRAGDSVVLVAGARYGTGSSRDWAAKGPRLLGVRAVVAVSFERIHRSNLIGMGILPLRLPAGMTPHTLQLRPGDRIEIDAEPEHVTPRSAVMVRIVRVEGRVETLRTHAAVETQLEAELLAQGGVIPFILQKTIAEHPPS